MFPQAEHFKIIFILSFSLYALTPRGTSDRASKQCWIRENRQVLIDFPYPYCLRNLFIPPANYVCGRVYCFHVVHTSDRVSVTIVSLIS